MSELWRWVDPRIEQVRLADLRSYLLARGWRIKPFPQPQVLLFEGPQTGPEGPIVQLVPANEQMRDYRRGVLDVITSLSALEQRHPVQVLEDVLRQTSAPAANGPGAFRPTDAPSIP